MFATPALATLDTIPARWTAATWQAGDHCHTLDADRATHAGDLFAIVQVRNDRIEAEVARLINEHADETAAEACGFDTFDAAREWAEETLNELTA